MYNALRDILYGDEFSVVEQFEMPGRDPRYAKIPRFLIDSRVGQHLNRLTKDRPLWAHQAQALEALGCDENVVLSTGTASGKSLVFQSIAFHKVLLNRDSRVLVFYPLKALAADQIRGWKEMAHSLELDETIIGRIDGTVPVKDREDVLRSARIVVMTPDVCHAWLMSRLALPVVRNFVRSLAVIVMDEAHTLEGIFGSNFAFLIRRMIAARSIIQEKEVMAQPLQLVAATATIKNPGEHLALLTGSKFSVIDHEADSARQYERFIAHIACPVGEGPKVAKALHDSVLANGDEGGFITFLDSRKGVEGLAIKSEETSVELFNANVLPYRAGYDTKDRQEIERRLQAGSLRGVVSTSALELGIDIPHLRIGFNVGVPVTRKAYRQRLGRVGRTGPGAFVVIAPEQAFRAYGTTFREYHEMSVEPSYLYLDNRFMQFAHGRCLALELEALGASARTPTRAAWPRGFRDMHAAARPGGNRPPEYDAIAAIGGDTPHYNYPLRNVGEMNFQIKMNSNSESIGDVNLHQALRECYPGATYLHLARAYEVAAWHTNSFDLFIRVKPSVPNRLTQPRIKTWINAGITSADILEDHIVASESGFLTECQMQITERVEGYIDGHTGEFHSYQDLQQRDPNLRARSRNFRTSGILLCVKQDWFKKTSVKRAFADLLREVFVREYSISPQDIGSAASNISIRSGDGGGLHGACIAIYDETYGSLRLTERLYLEFNHVLARLSAAMEMDSAEYDLDSVIVTRIQDEISTFTVIGATNELVVDAPTGYERVFTKGSRVCYQQAGAMSIDVEVIQPTIMDGKLMYQVKIPLKPGQQPAKKWIAASAIEPSAIADVWDYAWWNRESEEYENPSDSEDLYELDISETVLLSEAALAEDWNRSEEDAAWSHLQ